MLQLDSLFFPACYSFLLDFFYIYFLSCGYCGRGPFQTFFFVIFYGALASSSFFCLLADIAFTFAYNCVVYSELLSPTPSPCTYLFCCLDVETTLGC